MITTTIAHNWELVLKTDSGELTANGAQDGGTVRITASVPCRGIGPMESGGERAAVTVKATEFDRWIDLIAKARGAKPTDSVRVAMQAVSDAMAALSDAEAAASDSGDTHRESTIADLHVAAANLLTEIEKLTHNTPRTR